MFKSKLFNNLFEAASTADEVKCSKCHGLGKIKHKGEPDEICPKCHGEGIFKKLTPEEYRSTVTQPAAAPAFNAKREAAITAGSRKMEKDKTPIPCPKCHNAKKREIKGKLVSTVKIDGEDVICPVCHGKGTLEKELSQKEQFEHLKADFGIWYTKNRATLAGLFQDLKDMPFRLPKSSSRAFVKVVGQIFAENEDFADGQSLSPGMQELIGYIRNVPDFGFNSSLLKAERAGIGTTPALEAVEPLKANPAGPAPTGTPFIAPPAQAAPEVKEPSVESSAAKNGPAYVVFNALVFPLLGSNLTTLIFGKDNIASFFNELSGKYSGSVLNPIQFSPETNFSSLEHIKDEEVKDFVRTLQEILQSNEQEDAELKRGLLLGLDQISRGLKEHTRRSVGNNKHTNEIAKTIYYAIASGFVPYNLDLFEVDNDKVKQYFDNPGDREMNVSPDSTDTLIAAKRVLILENPFLHKGTLQMNARDTLAFEYARKTEQLSKNKRNKDVKEAETLRQINESSIKFFQKALDKFPNIAKHFQKLDEVLSGFYLENVTSQITDIPTKGSTSSSIEALGNSAAAKLHEFAVTGLDVIEADFTNESLLLSAFLNIAKNDPELTRMYSAETDKKTYIVTHFLDPFKETLLTRLQDFAALTSEDATILFKTAIACTSAMGNKMKPVDLKPILAEYKTYLTTSDLTSNGFRLDGFSFLRSILKLDVLLLEADRIIHGKVREDKGTKPEEPSEDEEPDILKRKGKRNEKEIKASHDYLAGLQKARQRILYTEHLLGNLNAYKVAMLNQIKQAINNADIFVLNSLVYGITKAEEESPVSNFIQNIVTRVYEDFFSEKRKNLLLLATGETDEDIAKEIIIKDLIEKAKLSLLATEGVFNARTTAYPGLTNDLMNFINLAAAISQKFTGLSVDAEGKASLDFGIEASSQANSFFGNFFFGTLPTSIESDPVIKMCYHKFLLIKFAKLVAPILQTTKVENILMPVVRSQNPEATKQISEYFTTLHNDCSAGLKKAVDYIDTQILEQAGGAVKIFVLEPDESGYISRVPFRIPRERGVDFERVTRLLGNKAVGHMVRRHNVKKSSQLFLNRLVINPEAEVAKKTKDIAEESQEIVKSIQNAINVIATAINIKVAKVFFEGNDESEQAIIDLIKTYAKDGDDNAIDAINNKRKAANALIDKFARESGFRGTELITQDDNRIKNPLLAQILDKFDQFIQTECNNQAILDYSELVATSKKEGTWEASGMSNVLPKTGMVFWEVVEPTTEEATAEGQSETEVAPAETPESSGQLIFDEQDGIAKFNPSKLLRIKKLLYGRAAGENLTALGKDKAQGTNYAAIKSYAQYNKELQSAIVVAVRAFADFFESINHTDIAEQVSETGRKAAGNCDTMTEFFTILTHVETGSVDNVGVQTNLLGTLARLHDDAAITEKDDTSVPKDQKVINRLPELFTTPKLETGKLDKDGNMKKTKLGQLVKNAFTKQYPGAEHVFHLLKQGYTIPQITQSVNTIILEHSTEDTFLDAAYNPIPGAEEEKIEPGPEDPRIQTGPKYNEPGQQERELAFIKSVSSPIQPYTVLKPRPVKPQMGPDGKPLPPPPEPPQVVLNSNFVDRYVTLLDPKLYDVSNTRVSPKTKQFLKNMAVKFVAGFPALFTGKNKAQELATLQTDLHQAVQNGQGHSLIMGGPVTDIVTNPQLLMSDSAVPVTEAKKKKKEEVVEAPVPAPETPEVPSTEDTLSYEEKKKQERETSANSVLTSLAAICVEYHEVEATDAGLMQQGSPFTFGFLSNLAYVLPVYNDSLMEAVNVIQKRTAMKDALKFEINIRSANRYFYYQIYHFNRIKRLVAAKFINKAQSEIEAAHQK